MHVVRHLLGERQQRGADSGVVLQWAEDVAEFFRWHIRLLRQGEDNPLLAHPPERNFHALSGGERHAVRNAVGKRVRDILMHNVHNYLCVQDTPPFLPNALIYHCSLYIGMPKGSRKKGMFLRFPKTKKAVARPLFQ